jgi:protein TonB
LIAQAGAFVQPVAAARTRPLESQHESLKVRAAMMAQPQFYRDRIRAAAPALAVHVLLAFLFLRAFGLTLPPPPSPILQLVDLAAPEVPPPRPIVDTRPRRARREGAAAPPNRESRPTEIVAPPTVLPLPPIIAAAPIAGPGAEPESGAAPLPGPGTGAGGRGNGTGSGGFGDGPGGGGDGDGGGGFTPPRRIRGRISDRDYPTGLGEAGIGGTVEVLYAVEPDGRASHCEIVHSSGSAALDATTCRLIVERFRFEPSRDRAGRPVRSRIVQNHSWEVEDDPRDEEPPPPRRRRFRL